MNEEAVEVQYKNNVDFDDIINRRVANEKTIIQDIQYRANFKQEREQVVVSNINFYSLILKNSDRFSYKDSEESDINIIGAGNIYFKECVFKKIEINKYLYKSFIFENCKFEEIIFEEIEYDDRHLGKIELLITDEMKYISNFINDLTIKNSNFNNIFYINNQKIYKNEVKINSVSIQESKFYANFKLHHCIVDDIVLNGVDFKANADFFKSEFGNEKKSADTVFSGINFDKLVIFEECVFKKKFTMEYCTFESLVQFRNATFKQGLDLDRTNILKDLNFYGIKKLDEDNSKQNTSQETYKIVKYHSEKNGSVIQGNKYHALELEKKKEDLDKQKTITQERIVFWFNWTTSKFGTNWAYALGWMFIVGLISASIINYKDVINFYNIKPIYTMPLFQLDLLYEYTCKILTQIFTYVSIASVDNFKGHPIIFFFNKVALGYLYYQFVTAVRKDTRK